MPQLDVDAVFGRDVVREAEHVERLFRVSWVLQQVALLATLWAYARRGPVFVRESAAGPIGTGMLLGMLGLGIVWLVELPFGLVDLWWARRYDLTEAGYLEWAFGDWFTLGAAFLSISLALVIVMLLARWLRRAVVDPGCGGVRRDRRPVHVRVPVLGHGDDTSRRSEPAGGAAAYERMQGIWACRCRSRT